MNRGGGALRDLSFPLSYHSLHHLHGCYKLSYVCCLRLCSSMCAVLMKETDCWVGVRLVEASRAHELFLTRCSLIHCVEFLFVVLVQKSPTKPACSHITMWPRKIGEDSVDRGVPTWCACCMSSM